MDDDDLYAIIDALEEELIGSGLSEIADERNYVSDSFDGEEPRLLPPRARLIEMLFAFDRHLSVEDVATYRTALARISEVTKGEGPYDAEIELTADRRGRRIISISEQPELGSLRRDLKDLIRALQEDGDETPSGGGR